MDRRSGLPVVGMVGGGQLARMTHQAAIALGQSLRVLATSGEESAAVVAADVVLGAHTSYPDLERFAAGCDVLTWDHEHVPTEHIRALAAAGHTVLPGADALRYAQDKQAMRTRLGELGVAVPAWAPVRAISDAATSDAATSDIATSDIATSDIATSDIATSDIATSDVATSDIAAFGAVHGWPLVLKAVRGGYDGRGVWVVADPAAAAPVLASGTPLIVEEFVVLQREYAAVVARSPFGQVAAWPVVQTVQRDGICVEVLAPAPGLDERTATRAQELAIGLATELDVVGVLAVELFGTGAGLLVNELAMRPHNSAHWTIEGARTSQFEQHLRAVLDYPLGAPTMTAPAVVMVNVLGGPQGDGGVGLDERVHHLMAHWPGVKVHLYGKASRPGRKIGHVTALGADMDTVRAQARAAAAYLGGHTTLEHAA